MTARLRAWLLQSLIAVDQLAAVVIAGPFYVLLARGERPSADETISSIVGRSAIAGARWALIAESVLDWIFACLGDGPDHCRRSIEWDEIAPLP